MFGSPEPKVHNGSFEGAGIPKKSKSIINGPFKEQVPSEPMVNVKY